MRIPIPHDVILNYSYTEKAKFFNQLYKKASSNQEKLNIIEACLGLLAHWIYLYDLTSGKHDNVLKGTFLEDYDFLKIVIEKKRIDNLYKDRGGVEWIDGVHFRAGSSIK